ncbi:3-isopropylmalate dehydrogenase [Pseudomonas aeruginosa]
MARPSTSTAPLADQTLQRAPGRCGAAGRGRGPKWDRIERDIRPERGLLKIRSQLGLFANLRPAILYPQLAAASSLKPEVVAGLDILIVRELTGGIYFGQPASGAVLENGERQASTPCRTARAKSVVSPASVSTWPAYATTELCSVDKANVLASSQLWREVVEEVAKDYPDVELSHMYVDNAAMQLVRAPKQFDVMVTDNMFGDILSDEASMLTGSIGMLPSASLDANNKGMYEPLPRFRPGHRRSGHRQPVGDHPLGLDDVALQLQPGDRRRRHRAGGEQGPRSGVRTGDIWSEGCRKVGTREMGDAVVAALKNL